MNRLIATIRRDMTVQYRYRLYAVTGFMVLVWGVLLRLVARVGQADAGALVPAFLVFNLIITTFYFMAALLLFEKDEGTLTALVTTPLRGRDYLASKVVTLTLLALVESLLIVVLLFGTAYRWIPLLGGTTLLGVMYVLAGFISVVRYDAINAWLMPSVVVVTALVLPLLAHFGLVGSWLYYLHPTGPALRLVEAAFVPMQPGVVGLAAAAALLWTGAAFMWARRRFQRFVVRTARTSSYR